MFSNSGRILYHTIDSFRSVLSPFDHQETIEKIKSKATVNKRLEHIVILH